MTRSTWGNIPATIEQAIAEFGPMTAVELYQHVPGLPNDIRKACVRMIKPVVGGPRAGLQRLHIKEWVHDVEGVRDYPRPVYALGPGKNAPRPKAKPRRDIVREWYRKTRKLRTHNFVFNLGLPA